MDADGKMPLGGEEEVDEDAEGVGEGERSGCKGERECCGSTIGIVGEC
jgi:hypothetical protein